MQEPFIYTTICIYGTGTEAPEQDAGGGDDGIELLDHHREAWRFLGVKAFGHPNLE